MVCCVRSQRVFDSIECNCNDIIFLSVLVNHYTKWHLLYKLNHHLKQEQTKHKESIFIFWNIVATSTWFLHIYIPVSRMVNILEASHISSNVKEKNIQSLSLHSLTSLYGYSSPVFYVKDVYTLYKHTVTCCLPYILH